MQTILKTVLCVLYITSGIQISSAAPNMYDVQKAIDSGNAHTVQAVLDRFDTRIFLDELTRNGGILSCALNFSQIDEENERIALALLSKYSPETINTPLGDNNATPLGLAIESGSIIMVQKCLELQADSNIQETNGTSMILKALPHDDILKLLLQQPKLTRETVNAAVELRTPLNYALSDARYNKNIKDLLSAQANPYVKDENGHNCFTLAEMHKIDLKNLIAELAKH